MSVNTGFIYPGYFNVSVPMGLGNLDYDPFSKFLRANQQQLALTNPMLIGLTGGNVLPGMPSVPGTTSNPNFVSQAQVAAQRIARETAQKLGTLHQSLQSLLDSDQLTNAQKAKVQAQIDKIVEMKEKIQRALQNQNIQCQELYALENEVKQLEEAIKKFCQELADEVSNTTPGTTTPGTNTPGTTTPDTNNTEPSVTGRPEAIGAAPDQSDCETICAAVLRSVVCAGTDHPTLEGALGSLTAGNIIEVVQHWEKGYGKHTATGNEGFFAKIFDDIGDDDQAKYIPIILNLLVERAKANNMYDEIATDVASVNKGLATGASWKKLWCGTWMDDHQLANDLMKIVNKIAAKEAQNKVKAEKENAANKAKKEKEVAERKTQVTAEMKNNFANEMKKALNLSETPQLAAGLKVETDENGEFTGYSIEVNTPEGKVTCKGRTYRELVLEIEKQGLTTDVLIRQDIA